jgi:Zn-dependent protease
MLGVVELVLGLLWYAVLLLSLTFHEAAHAWAARRGGDPTAYHEGQVSLDPRPHIKREPMGTVFVPLFSFALWGWMMGWASTPYDPRWADRYPRRAAWMSLAGPAANLALVLAAALLVRVGMLADVFYAPDRIGFTQVVASASGGVWVAVAMLVSITFTLNLLLVVLNLIPVPPLDGAGVIGLFVDEARARRLRLLAAQPQVSLVGLLIAWFLIGQIFWPIHGFAIRLLYPEFSWG